MTKSDGQKIFLLGRRWLAGWHVNKCRTTVHANRVVCCRCYRVLVRAACSRGENADPWVSVRARPPLQMFMLLEASFSVLKHCQHALLFHSPH
jgi:hypothetical protein